MRTQLLCFLLAFGLLASACGGSDGPETSSNDTTSSSSSGASAPTPTTTDTAAPPIEGDSPIENLLGVPVFDETAMNAYFTNLTREAEVFIARCMLAEGFEYTPVTVAASSTSEAKADSLEFAEERGFDIIAQFNEAEYNPATAAPDKNTQYLAELTDGERDAYFVALSGSTNIEVDSDFDDGQLPSGGCQGEAEEEIFSIIGLFDAIGPTLDGYYDLYISDSRIIATTGQWQECMAEAGFPFENNDAMYEYVFDKLDEVLSNDANFIPVDEDDFPQSTTFSTGLFEGGFRPPLVPEAQAAVDAIGGEEIEIAVANWTCREPIKDAELAVQREYESQFVAEVEPQVSELRGEN